MKTWKILLFCIVFVSFAFVSKARPVYVYEKSGGQFVVLGFYIGYDTVTQQVTFTTDGVGNPIELTSIVCKGAGVLKCKKSGANGVIRFDNGRTFGRILKMQSAHLVRK